MTVSHIKFYDNPSIGLDADTKSQTDGYDHQQICATISNVKFLSKSVHLFSSYVYTIKCLPSCSVLFLCPILTQIGITWWLLVKDSQTKFKKKLFNLLGIDTSHNWHTDMHEVHTQSSFYYMKNTQKYYFFILSSYSLHYVVLWWEQWEFVIANITWHQNILTKWNNNRSGHYLQPIFCWASQTQAVWKISINDLDRMSEES
jgi:hypothetical protein